MTADELVAFAEGLAGIAGSGGGAKALADHLARRIHAAVLVEDAQWRHVAAAGGRVPSSVRSMTENDDPGFSRLRDGHAGRTIAIVSGDLRLGRLSIFAEGDLDRHELFVRLAAGSIGVELARESSGRPGRRRAFWERLAARDYGDAAAARDDAASRGIVPVSHYVAVALEPESRGVAADAADQRLVCAAAQQIFRTGDTEPGILDRGRTILVFVPALREIDAANARTAASLMPRSLMKKHPDMHVGGGVGTRVTMIDLARSIEEAVAAMTIARRLHGTGQIGVYDDLGVYPILLQGAGQQQLREFAARTLAPLRSYDEKHQTELERTLRLYFDVGENVKTASTRLNVHRHTVFYRLRQIGEICGCKLDDPHDQLTLRTAMAIDALNQ